MPSQSPRDVVELALNLKRQRNWRALADLADARSLHRFRSDRIPPRPPPPLTIEEYRKGWGGDPEMPLEVAEFMVARINKEQQSAAQQIDDSGAAVDTELLSDREIMVRHLEANDSVRQLRRQHAGVDQPLLEVIDELPMAERFRVIGEVIDRPNAYVLYAIDTMRNPTSAAPGAVHIANLVEAPEGWRLEPSGPLFYDNMWMCLVAAGPVAADPYPQPSVRQAPWVSRRFDHEMAPGLFPGLLLRFAATPSRCDFAAHPKRIRTTRIDGAWSVQEHIGHLLDLEELGERRLDDFIAHADVLTAADMSNRKTHDAGHNDADPFELHSRFHEARDRLVKRLKALTAEQIGHSALHPRLGRRMNVVEWVYFMAEHDDHHLARIDEIMATLWNTVNHSRH